MPRFLTAIFKKENLRAIGIVTAFAGFVWFAVFGNQGLYQLHRSIKLKKEMQAEAVMLKERMERLKTQKDLLTDKEHLEMVIRQELGYVKPGEIVFQQMSP